MSLEGEKRTGIYVALLVVKERKQCTEKTSRRLKEMAWRTHLTMIIAVLNKTHH